MISNHRRNQNDDFQALCAQLRVWRLGQGLTLRAMAERMDTTHTFVHKCETAGRRIDPLELIAWFDACHVDHHDGIDTVAAIHDRFLGPDDPRHGRHL